jgi:tRNA-2-methylthio-N6-dimethylallyladenosine synthase
LENIGFEKILTATPLPRPHQHDERIAEEADLVIVNICSVRQSAVARAANKIKNLSAYTAAHARYTSWGGSKILLTGCILNKDKKELRKFCDGIFDINDLAKLPELLRKLGFTPLEIDGAKRRRKTKRSLTGFKIKERVEEETNHYLQIAPEYQSDIIAYVPIMTGCNNFCAYCVVPYLRGREISRSKEDILREVRALVERGTKEIWLLGQNVNSYKPNFAKLLQEVNDIPGNFWIRFTSSHPKNLSDEMIETFAKCEKAVPYLHLPIQSGDDEIVKAMNRTYTIKQYKLLIKKLRAAFKKYRQGLEKELTLSTDVIVGFPGERKRHFENTKKTFKGVGFAFAYISRYSPRPQTAASKLKDALVPIEKKRRKKELDKIVEKNALAFNQKFLNKTVDALILKKKNDFYFGKTRHYQTIRIANESGSRCLIGEFIKAKIIKATPYGLQGTIQ